jgi:hypothetical protein
MRQNRSILIALLLCALILWVHGMGFHPPESKQDFDISGILQPGMKMQLVHAPTQVTNLLGNPHDEIRQKADVAAKNWGNMREQQFIDFVFILLYWALFVFVVSACMRESNSGMGRLLGWLVVICITVAAVADEAEDAAILHVLQDGTGDFWPYHYCLTKWGFYFLALGFSSALFLGYPKFGDFGLSKDRSRWRKITGALFLTGAVLGVSGVLTIVKWQNGFLLSGGQIGQLGFISLLAFFWDSADSTQSGKQASSVVTFSR